MEGSRNAQSTHSLWQDDFSARRDAVDYRAVPAVSTMCGSTTLQFDNEDGPIVAWTDKACTVVNEPKAIILQRTRGKRDHRKLPIKAREIWSFVLSA